MAAKRIIWLGAVTLLMAVGALGQPTDKPAPRTIHDITALLDQYKPDPEKVAVLKAAVSREPPVEGDREALFRFYRARANVAQELGMVRQQVADLKRALELISGNDPRYLSTKQDWFHAEMDAGNFSNALRLKEEMVREGRGRTGRNFSDYLNLAGMYVRMGDLTEARTALRNAESLLFKLQRGRSWSERGDERIAHMDKVRGDVFQAEGKFEQAEQVYRKRLAGREEFLRTAEHQIAQRPGEPPRERFERARDGVERDLAANLRLQGRLSEAELVIRGVLTRSLSRLGRYAPGTARTIVSLARILDEQGRYQEAAVLAQAALDIYERISAAPESFRVVGARWTLGSALVAQSRSSEALAVYEAGRAALAADRLSLEKFGEGNVNWALSLIRTGRATDAVSMLEPLIRRTRERLGEAHYQVAEQRGFLAMALAEAGQRQRAFTEYQEAVKVLLARIQAASDEGGGVTARDRRRALILEGYIKLLHDLRDELRRPGFEPASEAFRMVDAMRAGSTQRALAASAARAAAGTPALAELVRKEQDARQQTVTLYEILLRMLAAPPDQQLPQVAAQMRARIQELEKERRVLFSDLEKHFPAYVNLINPSPATVEEARAALREGEALLSVLATEERTYVWVVAKQGAVGFHASNLGARALNRAVGNLRRALDPGDVPLERFPEFDLVAAHRLYAELLKPVEGAWKGAHTLMVVASGALAQLPFALLPTEPVAAAKDGARFAGYREVPWLIKQVAVTQLPAVNTLVTLRALPAANPARSAFIGFGDPQFGGDAPATAPQVALRMRNAALPRPELGKPADWVAYSQLSPLPDTRDEMLSIASVLKADAGRDVFLGTQASKDNVKKADLRSRRIVAFATHGLIPGDFPNLEEPALALSAPDGNAETGLLTLGDILALRMDADWVVLSACNTAAGDGAGAEAISGLGRGFFYAGSRALLVTHWPVETRSARQLVTTLFERYAGN
ncbi:MAG: CHAT domain-containing protein, partial [Burkholderiales bacterium]